jgi:RsiW-degrading membrane proteinase PrsW (M82 family)
MGLALSIFFGFAPMFLFAWFIYWLDRYEKEPKRLLGGVFIWGAVIAAGAAFIINTLLGAGVYLFTESETATELATTSLFAPVVEESLKGLAVLIVFWLFRREFDSLLDGVVYAAITALGFAATENAFYIYAYGYLEEGYMGLLGMVFVRVILVGWQHPFYTAFIGIGLAIARMNRPVSVKLLAPVMGWSFAVFAHAMHNSIATLAGGLGGLVFGTFLDWSGWFFMFLFIVWATAHERGYIERHLKEEVHLGTISPTQFKVAVSAWIQVFVRLNALLAGRYRATARFYHLCAELAHKKHHLKHLGEEGDGAHSNSAAIQRLRSELNRLSPLAHSS